MRTKILFIAAIWTGYRYTFLVYSYLKYYRKLLRFWIEFNFRFLTLFSLIPFRILSKSSLYALLPRGFSIFFWFVLLMCATYSPFNFFCRTSVLYSKRPQACKFNNNFQELCRFCIPCFRHQQSLFWFCLCLLTYLLASFIRSVQFLKT